jgi:[amino group carrier protein]-L-2-aminoadipate 6-kinase
MIIIKIGGGKNINVPAIIKDLARLSKQFIIVHGANAVRDKLAEDLGRPKKVITSVSGYQSVLSDETAIDVFMMAYAGLKNKRIVELCQQQGINAVGLTGLDGKTVVGVRNNGIRAKEGDKIKIVRDFSGKPKSVNKALLQLLLDKGYVPVLCPPILDKENNAINTENDDIINSLVEAFHPEKVISLIEAPGFLENKNDPSTLVPTISQEQLAERETQVEGRMKRKMLALRKLFENGTSTVIISDGRTDTPVSDALAGKGTVIQ